MLRYWKKSSLFKNSGIKEKSLFLTNLFSIDWKSSAVLKNKLFGFAKKTLCYWKSGSLSKKLFDIEKSLLLKILPAIDKTLQYFKNSSLLKNNSDILFKKCCNV